MDTSKKHTNELLAKDIEYIKGDIKTINEKLDKKYVSHETFDLSISSINKAIQSIVYFGMFLITPIYGAIIALLFKLFANK